VTIPEEGGHVQIKTFNERYLRHGIIMWISWFILGIVMISTTRWFVYITVKANYIHAFTGLTIVLLNSYAAFDIISLNGFKTEGSHNQLGLILFFGLLFFALNGITTFCLKKRM
jgi:hypothetical protein